MNAFCQQTSRNLAKGRDATEAGYQLREPADAYLPLILRLKRAIWAQSRWHDTLNGMDMDSIMFMTRVVSFSGKSVTVTGRALSSD